MALTVSIIGRGQHADRRAAVVADRSDTVLHRRARAPDSATGDPLDEALFDASDVLFVTGPTAVHFRLAKAALKRGVHVFLEWPPATSLPEAEAMVDLAEESGSEVGVSRPLRFHPAVEALPDEGRATLIVLRQEVDGVTPAFWPPRCADAIDLCCTLARSHSVQRIDAEAVPHSAAWPEAMAFALRFHNGTYAQISLYRCHQPAGDRLYVAGSDFQMEADWSGTEPVHRRAASGAVDVIAGAESLIERETHAFLDAIAAGRIPPVSVLDGLHTMRLVERLMERLR
jgi:predicted dehydrogenase